MNVNVRLLGTLGRSRSGYDHEKGIDVEMPDEAKVRDLLNRLKIPGIKKGVVAMDGRLLSEDAPLGHGSRVTIFEPVFGG